MASLLGHVVFCLMNGNIGVEDRPEGGVETWGLLEVLRGGKTEVERRRV